LGKESVGNAQERGTSTSIAAASISKMSPNSFKKNCSFLLSSRELAFLAVVAVLACAGTSVAGVKRWTAEDVQPVTLSSVSHRIHDARKQVLSVGKTISSICQSSVREFSSIGDGEVGLVTRSDRRHRVGQQKREREREREIERESERKRERERERERER